MRHSLNTLFGRIALLSAAVLFTLNAGWLAPLATQPLRTDDPSAYDLAAASKITSNETTGGASDTTFDTVPDARPTHAARIVTLPGTSPIDPAPLSLQPHLVDLHAPITQGAVHDVRPIRTALRSAPDASRLAAPELPQTTRVAGNMSLMLAASLVLAMVAVWQMRRPLTRIGGGFRTMGEGQAPAPLAENGPREVRELIRSFNGLVARFKHKCDEHAAVVAGVGEEIGGPLNRLKQRAAAMPDAFRRDAFIEDIEQFEGIVGQLQAFAGQNVGGPVVEVDALLAARYPQGNRDTLIRLDLRAGPSFQMPRALLDRFLSNLIDNALEHGKPPIDITTARATNGWMLRVRDHGEGIDESRIDEALKPFVRLSPGGKERGHCGLGLAIITRLAKNAGGRADVTNHPEGGLQVRIVVPGA